MNQPPDHEKSAMMQMILEFQGREVQLRAALSRAQSDLNAEQAAHTATKAELAALKEPASPTEGQADAPP